MTPLLLLLAVASAASAPAGQPATRAELAAQRAALEQRFAHEDAECQRRFAVSACLDEVRQRRHDALAPLIRREHELAAEERREHAATQAQRVRERGLAASSEGGLRRERVIPAAPSTPASRPVRTRSPEAAERQQREAADKAQAEAAERRAKTQEREQRMRQRLADHAAREKARTKPLAPPLPLPGASTAASAAQ